MQISQEPANMAAKQECAGCKKEIGDRFMLKALEQFWHEDCLKCSCCDCRLGEVGSTLFTKANLLLCRRDYLRLFGTTGYCSACSKMIPAFEMVMRAKSNVYHLECFACQQCNHRFCVGDKFYLCENKILCEYDYEERMLFANMSYNYSALSQIKRQTQSLSDDLSSGYGSPSPSSLWMRPVLLLCRGMDHVRTVFLSGTNFLMPWNWWVDLETHRNVDDVD